MISDVTSATNVNNTQNKSASESAFSSLDKDAFLQLLVAQLKYQNPLSPKDGQEYLAQAAQFATVERLENLSKGQSEAVAYQQLLLSTSMVGKQVSGIPAGETEAITGHVTSVVFDGGVPNLVVAGQKLPIGAVNYITE